MSAFSRFTPLISALPSTVPFVGPEALERQRGLTVKARIGANENGFGPAPSVIETMREQAGDIWKYNDPENFALKEALAAHLGVKPANIAVGEGIDSLLGLIVRMVVEPGAPVVTSLGGYPTFNFHVAGFGGRLVNRTLYQRSRGSRRPAAGSKARECAARLFRQPRQPDGKLVGCRQDRRLCPRSAGKLPARSRRSL